MQERESSTITTCPPICEIRPICRRSCSSTVEEPQLEIEFILAVALIIVDKRLNPNTGHIYCGQEKSKYAAGKPTMLPSYISL
jgi:hypothetical protein